MGYWPFVDRCFLLSVMVIVGAVIIIIIIIIKVTATIC
jgi:hypothetical protein